MSTPNIPNRVQILKQKFTQSLGLPFRDLLPESTITEALKAEKLNTADGYLTHLLPFGHFYLRF